MEYHFATDVDLDPLADQEKTCWRGHRFALYGPSFTAPLENLKTK